MGNNHNDDNYNDAYLLCGGGEDEIRLCRYSASPEEVLSGCCYYPVSVIIPAAKLENGSEWGKLVVEP